MNTDPNEKAQSTDAEIVSTGATTETKEATDLAPEAENTQDQSPSVEEASYEVSLARSITTSNYGVTVVAHKDFVRMNAAGLIDFETKKLNSGQQLEISENPDCPTGSYWDKATFIK